MRIYTKNVRLPVPPNNTRMTAIFPTQANSSRTTTPSVAQAGRAGRRSRHIWMKVGDMMDPKPLRIELLGGFRVMVGDEVIPAEVWRRRKVRSLVKLLALAHGHRLHREQVMESLWPERRSQAALNSLHQTLYLARRILEPGSSTPARYFLLQDEIVTLAPPELVWVDVAAFEAAVAQARQRQDMAAYRAGLALYSGELLPEDRYEEWASPRREALRQDYLALLGELTRLAEARADYALAIETLHKALAADPAHEEAHRDLMRLYALTGQRQQALRQYQALREALATRA